MEVNYSGIVIAGIGFFLTRFTVTLTVADDPIKFYFAGIVPLMLGLGLAAFGVALTVGDVESAFVRTTASWCVLGTGAMLVLVLLTLVGASAGMLPVLADFGSRTYLTNFMIGGSVGGTLTGLYAARNHRQRRDLQRQANRLEVLNRLLRHEVLNSITAIHGYASIMDERPEAGREVINQRVSAIEGTIEEVKYLTDSGQVTADSNGIYELAQCLETSIDDITDRYPDAEVTLDRIAEPIPVRANNRLDRVFVPLLENAIVYGEQTAHVSVMEGGTEVHVSVTDDGPGLPERQRELLEDGTIGQFDDPGTGFGLNVVRLLVDSYGGSIDTTVTDAGTTVTVVLSKPDEAGAGVRPDPTGVSSVNVSPARLFVTVGAALAAGGVMGITADLLSGTIPVIGALYGIERSIVGWITHEFHSIVFGFVFAGAVSLAPNRVERSAVALIALGAVWGFVLSILASGFVMPIWLLLVGIPTSIPDITGQMIAGHVLWGVSLGFLMAIGYARVVPRIPTGAATTSVGL